MSWLYTFLGDLGDRCRADDSAEEGSNRVEAPPKRPIQVYLDEYHERALRRLAAEQGVPLSELIRRGIDLLLEQEPAARDPAMGVVSLGRSGVPDLATRHHDYLAEELAKEARR
jgi:16S rRNA U516 pseudouridylate synthase RsuA-like enzyme